MTELLSNPFVDFVSRVVLPGLSVLAALSTLVVLLFTLRRAGQTLTRSVTPQIECYLRARQSSQVFDFVIANFGLGSAYCVGFKLDADEDDFDAHKVIMKQRGTDTPFSIIEPGGQITNMFGFGPGLLGPRPRFEAVPGQRNVRMAALLVATAPRGRATLRYRCTRFFGTGSGVEKG